MSDPTSAAGGAVTVHHGDCLDVMATMPAASIDTIITDPPYNLSFMGRKWDGWESQAAFQRWCLSWAREAYRVLKPGGHLLAFGGTRTHHRLTAGIEDAGFEIRDTITWLYAQGFPKSLDVSKAIDKVRRRDYVLAAIDLGLHIPGNNLHDWTKAEHSPGDAWWKQFKEHVPAEQWRRIEREVVGKRVTGLGTGRGAVAYIGDSEDRNITAPATDDARRWQGWGTALKPSSEPIVVARKPLAGGTVAGNVLTYGTGALNIDGCRVPGYVPATVQGQSLNAGTIYGTDQRDQRVFTPNDAGRWPTNVVLTHAATPDGADLCGDGCVPGCPVADLDAQSGVLTSGANPARRGSDTFRDAYGQFAGQREIVPARGADSGGASRFFPTFRYQAKAPAGQRPRVGGVAHPTVKPLELMRWLVRLTTVEGGLVLDPFAGSGTTLEAAVREGVRAVGVEAEAAYLPLIAQRLRCVQLSI